MKFEWDENKNEINKSKHGISFELASLVFHDPYVVSWEDHRYEEERWQSLGLITDKVICLAHTVGEENYEEIIRIISARKATASEERRYYFNRQNEM